MAFYRVVLFDRGVWDGQEGRKVEADNPAAAAEMICGPGLIEGAAMSRLRAQVAPVDRPGEKTMFMTD